MSWSASGPGGWDWGRKPEQYQSSAPSGPITLAGAFGPKAVGPSLSVPVNGATSISVQIFGDKLMFNEVTKHPDGRTDTATILMYPNNKSLFPDARAVCQEIAIALGQVRDVRPETSAFYGFPPRALAGLLLYAQPSPVAHQSMQRGQNPWDKDSMG